MIGLHKAQSLIEKLKTSALNPHAILLYGPSGAGKSLLAHELIEHWLGNERAIQAFHRGTNPDLLKIEPMGKSRTIRLGQIIANDDKEVSHIPMTDFVRVPPLYSKHKVVWILDADCLGHASFNSLLKPLEEPSPYVKYILTTSVPSRIKATILSRCLAINCELPSGTEIDQMFPALTETMKWMGEGAPGMLKEIEAHPETYAPIVDLASMIVHGGPMDILLLSERSKSVSELLEKRFPSVEKRNNQAKFIELLSVVMSRQYPDQTRTIGLLIEAHRKVVGNASFGLVLDQTFARILIPD
jgi:hypothetical protein